MGARFGRNQRKKMQQQVITAQEAALHAQRTAFDAHDRLERALRDQLRLGKIPIEVEHFLSREDRSVVIHAIFDERRSNLHYQHKVSEKELAIQRDINERERLGQYLGRAIGDRIADAYAGRKDGTSKDQPHD